MLNEPTLQYTPKPILSPSRNGRGLYWQAVTSWPSSSAIKGNLFFLNAIEKNIIYIVHNKDIFEHSNIIIRCYNTYYY
jgi:hypothetical protein